MLEKYPNQQSLMGLGDQSKLSLKEFRNLREQRKLSLEHENVIDEVYYKFSKIILDNKNHIEISRLGLKPVMEEKVRKEIIGVISKIDRDTFNKVFEKFKKDIEENIYTKQQMRRIAAVLHYAKMRYYLYN